MKKITILGQYLWLVMFLAVGFIICKCSCVSCKGGDNDTLSVDSIVRHDTVYITKHDTLPAEKGETVIKYVTIPCKPDTIQLQGDSLTLPVVQKVYSDDTTYTAYVSGLGYENLPKLDSIAIRQKEIINTIEKTITIHKKRSRWSVGFQAGYGLGLQSRTLEPYVGVGVGYSLLPP